MAAAWRGGAGRAELAGTGGAGSRGAPGSPEAPGWPPQQVGLWVRLETVADLQGLRAAVAMARRLGAGVIFAQAMARGEAAYRSSLWPMVRRPGMAGDPLALAVEQAHRAGVQLHAWITAYAWGRLDAPPAGDEHPLNRYPQWVTVDRAGRSLWRYRVGEHPEVNALFVDPGLEGVSRTVAETVMELVRRYDVDGVHLDYIRYPGPDLGYHPLAVRRFWQQWRTPQPPGVLPGLPGAPPPSPAAPQPEARAEAGQDGATVELPSAPRELEAWQEFRRAQVSGLVRRIREGLRAEGVRARLSAAVIPDPSRAAGLYAQDWPAWLAQGLVDFVVLMSYSPDPQVVRGQVQRAVQVAARRAVWAGVGVFRLGAQQGEQLAQLVQAARAGGAAGVALFSFESLEGVDALQQAARQSLSGQAGR